jgi:heat shock protein 4
LIFASNPELSGCNIMSVVGFDIGNDGCFISEIKRGGVDMVLNSNSNRRTPNLVSIQEGKTRLTGEQAGSIAKSNFKNTILSVKPYIGRTFKECEEELKNSPVKAVEMDDGSVGFEVNYNDKPTIFSCQQALAMMIKELCSTVEKSKADGSTVRDVVIGVPGYFVESQRLAILDACEIAGAKPLGLINELTAVALSYGIFKSARNLFHESEPQNVMFVDVGFRSTSVCIASFVQGKLQIKSCAYNVNQGSETVDLAIVKEMAAAYLEKHPGEDPMTKAKAMIKMKAAADKAKKTISPEGVAMAQITVECLMGDYDLTYRLELEKYEELVAPFVAQLEVPLQKALADAGMKPSDLSCVEIVGGGSRIKGVKACISKVLELDATAQNFGVSTTMNADEAVARGCALMCAMRSPRFSVKAFDVSDVAQYPITLQFDSGALGVSIDVEKKEEGKEGEGKDGEGKDDMEVVSSDGPLSLIKEGTSLPSPVNLSVELKNSQAEFELRSVIPVDGDALKYAAFVVEGSDAMDEGNKGLELMRYAVKVNGDTKEPVKLTVAHNASGILEVGLKGAKKSSLAAEQVSVSTLCLGKLSTQQIQEFVELEDQMAKQDRSIQETADMRNELETFLYAFRDELCGDLQEFLETAQKDDFNGQITGTEDWLYSDEGFDSTLQVYADKLKELQALQGQPVRRRIEGQQRPAAVEGLTAALAKYVGMAGSLPGCVEHPKDKERVNSLHGLVNTWLTDLKAQQEPLPKTADPVLTVSSVRTKTKLIERLQRQVTSIAELRKAVSASFVLNYSPGASNSAVRNLTEGDIKLLQTEAGKVTTWLNDNVDSVAAFELPEKEDGRPSPSSTDADSQRKNITFIEEKAKALSELRSKLLEVLTEPPHSCSLLQWSLPLVRLPVPVRLFLLLCCFLLDVCSWFQ